MRSRSEEPLRSSSGTRAGSAAVDDLYWRAEILQALYWLRGEGLGTEVEPAALARFLAVDTGLVASQLEKLAANGFLEPEGGPPYRLTPLGVAEGGRSFRDEFADLVRRGHGECGPGCWCQDPSHAGDPCPGKR